MSFMYTKVFTPVYFCVTGVLVELVLERHISRSFGRKILWYYMMKKVDTSSYVTAVSVISYMHS